MKVLVINEKTVYEILEMKNCIEVVREGLLADAKGHSINPLRVVMWLKDGRGGLISMPAALLDSESNKEKDIIGIKVITVFPENTASGYHSHYGMVLLFDPIYGFPRAIIDAASVTAIRTAAASAVATDVLARKNARSLAIIGSGHQAHTHFIAMQKVRNIEFAKVYSRNFEKTKSFVSKLREESDIPVEAVETVEEAIRDMDIICTTTSASTPLIFGKHLKPGMHINAVGACTPTTREIDSEAVSLCKFYYDKRESVEKESGEYIISKTEGLISESHLLGEIGQLLDGKVQGRASDQEITLFKSLGIAIEDLVSVQHVYNLAVLKNLGQNVDW